MLNERNFSRFKSRTHRERERSRVVLGTDFGETSRVIFKTVDLRVDVPSLVRGAEDRFAFEEHFALGSPCGVASFPNFGGSFRTSLLRYQAQ